MGVLLGGCYGNIPDGVPGVVEVWQDGVDAGVMGGDRIVVGEGRDGVKLERGEGRRGGGGGGERGRTCEGQQCPIKYYVHRTLSL